MPTICYPILFNNTKAKVLLDLGNKINIIIPVFIDNLGFFARKINIKAQKINRLILKIFEIVIIGFLL